LPQQADSHLDGARVLNDVGEGLLYHPVDGQPLRLVERSFLPLDGEGAVGAGAVGVADEVLDTGNTRGGGDDPVILRVEDGEQAAHLRQRLAAASGDRLERLDGLLRILAPRVTAAISLRD